MVIVAKLQNSWNHRKEETYNSKKDQEITHLIQDAEHHGNNRWELVLDAQVFQRPRNWSYDREYQQPLGPNFDSAIEFLNEDISNAEANKE